VADIVAAILMLMLGDSITAYRRYGHGPNSLPKLILTPLCIMLDK
jgi:hypothetical protein